MPESRVRHSHSEVSHHAQVSIIPGTVRGQCEPHSTDGQPEVSKKSQELFVQMKFLVPLHRILVIDSSGHFSCGVVEIFDAFNLEGLL